MNIQLFTFIFMWIASLVIMLSPVLIDKVNDKAKPWVVSALILVLIPFTLNLIARGGYRFIKLGNFGVDHKFIFLACGIAYAIASIFISSLGKVKQNLRAFGKDINSTGESLALLVPAFIVGLFLANVFNDGSRYIFRVSY
jgi:hypothetical protein